MSLEKCVILRYATISKFCGAVLNIPIELWDALNQQISNMHECLRISCAAVILV
jgi:hypothetical protein